MNRRIIISILIFFTGQAVLLAQNPETVYETVDSLVYTPVATYDSNLAGKEIFGLLKGSNVTVDQSSTVRDAMNSHIANNSGRSIPGYRVRIFFDNKQNARGESQAALARFRSRYPDISAYHSYSNPYFKVTVGDFRTKSEAMQLLQRIQYEFPASFVVKENINYPVVDRNKAVIVDTIKITRKIPVR